MKKLLFHIKSLQINKNKIWLFGYLFITFVIGGTIGALGFKYLATCKVKYVFINPSLGCSVDSNFDKSNPIVLKDKLTAFINSETAKGDVSHVSVYFRDLKDGPTMGINEDDLFISASLLKLPVALTYYKLSEDEMPDVLTRQLYFELGIGGGDNLQQFFKPAKSAIPGQTYLVNDLIKNSLIYSDNMSNDVLKTYLATVGNATNQDYLLRTFKELGLIEPTSVTTSDISTRAYASIFRQLYNASYLNNEDSEKVLSTLEQSGFNLGIVAGVPKGIKVANKFGERDLGKEKQLHDCGIIYYPNNPYLICVMTRGYDYNVLTGVISQISNMTYAEMNSRAK